MSKSKAIIAQAIADDLGIVLTSKATDLKTLARNPDTSDGLIFAFMQNDYIYYDVLKINRNVNGMRIKIPKVRSHPLIEERLIRSVYNCYFSFNATDLTILKIKKSSELHTRLPIVITADPNYTTSFVTPDLTMGLRRKALLFNRSKVSYEPFNSKD